MRRAVASSWTQGALGAVLVISIVVSALWALNPDRGLLDFGSFVMAGESQERGLNPYAVDQRLAQSTGYDFGYEDGRGYSPNLNPPISLYLFRPLAEIDPEAARTLLTVASVALFAATAGALLRRYRWQGRPLMLLWLVSLAGFWYVLWLGQIYMALLALGVSAWLLLEEEQRPAFAGVLIGLLVCIKPNFGIWPLLLLLGGQQRTGLVAIAVAGVMSAIPFALEGPSIYGQWLAAAAGYERTGLPANASIIGTAERLGVAELGYALAVALVAAAAAFVLRTRPSAKDTSAIGILVALLVGPLTWTGYTLFAVPLLMSRRWQRWELAVAGAMVLPVWLNTTLDRATWIPSAEVVGASLMLLLALTVRDVVGRANAAVEAPAERRSEHIWPRQPRGRGGYATPSPWRDG